MHVLALNLFRNYICKLIGNATSDVKRRIDRAVKEVTKSIPKSLCNSGRWPRKPNTLYGTYKVEECQKFIQWCLPYILSSVEGLQEDDIKIGMLHIDLAHIFYNHTRKQGWNCEDLNVARKLLQSWRILTEKREGPSKAPLQHVAGNAEMLDDIMRHGSHDGYWCYGFEREVSGYLAIATNNRENQVTYVNHHSRLLCSRVLQEIQKDEDGLLPYERALITVHNTLLQPEGVFQETMNTVSCRAWHGKCACVVSSQGAARTLWRQHSLPCCPCKRLLQRKGILISNTRKNMLEASGMHMAYLQEYWMGISLHLDGIEEEVSKQICLFDKILLNGELYKVGDLVVIRDGLEIAALHGECKFMILYFFSHEHEGEIEVFFCGEMFRHIENMVDGVAKVLLHDVTGMSLVDVNRMPFDVNCIHPVRKICHKFFLLSKQVGVANIAYEISDILLLARLTALGMPGCPPPWIEVNHILLAKRYPDAENLHHAVVRAVVHNDRRVLLAWLHNRSSPLGVWRVDIEDGIWHDWNICISVLESFQVTQTISKEVDGCVVTIPVTWRDLQAAE